MNTSISNLIGLFVKIPHLNVPVKFNISIAFFKISSNGSVTSISSIKPIEWIVEPQHEQNVFWF